MIPIIEAAFSDEILTSEEADNIIWLCNNFVSDSNYYDLVTSSIQFLSGMIHGILSDGIITDQEIYALKSWMSANDYLSGCYPFDEIESLLVSILEDGIITDDERNMLMAFLSNFVDLNFSYNLNDADIKELKQKYSIVGICSLCQQMDIAGNEISFTGQSTRQQEMKLLRLSQT